MGNWKQVHLGFGFLGPRSHCCSSNFSNCSSLRFRAGLYWQVVNRKVRFLRFTSAFSVLSSNFMDKHASITGAHHSCYHGNWFRTESLSFYHNICI